MPDKTHKAPDVEAPHFKTPIRGTVSDAHDIITRYVFTGPTLDNAQRALDLEVPHFKSPIRGMASNARDIRTH